MNTLLLAAVDSKLSDAVADASTLNTLVFAGMVVVIVNLIGLTFLAKIARRN